MGEETRSSWNGDNTHSPDRIELKVWHSSPYTSRWVSCKGIGRRRKTPFRHWKKLLTWFYLGHTMHSQYPLATSVNLLFVNDFYVAGWGADCRCCQRADVWSGILSGWSFELLWWTVPCSERLQTAHFKSCGGWLALQRHVGVVQWHSSFHSYGSKPRFRLSLPFRHCFRRNVGKTYARLTCPSVGISTMDGMTGFSLCRVTHTTPVHRSWIAQNLAVV